MTIVIADDSKLLRDRIKETLKGINNIEIVGEAVNGNEALQLVKELNPDLLILDIRMPELSGIQVLTKIKEYGYRVTICVLTNYPYIQYQTKCFEEGADYFFDKNQDLTVLEGLLKELAKSTIS